MLSVIIPAKNEVYLQRTIESVLDAAVGDIEVIVILDGYIPDPQINTNDNRVKFIHYAESIGQRQAINVGAKAAKGKYVMKLDAHCTVAKGFDVVLAENCEYDWTVIPRMYNLDVEEWKPKLHKRTDYMYISSPDAEKPFRATYYEGKEKDEGQKQPDNDKPIDDIMCCMGPCFFMHKDRFFDLGGMDAEGHGSWGQMGIELACKAWLSGGSLKVNKNTWFAHWFRGGGGPGFPYEISGRAVDAARIRSRDLWLNNKWPMAIKKFDWMLEKFNPPGWKRMPNKLEVEFHDKLFKHVFDKEKRNFPTWKGNKIIKFPTDMILYHQAIWEKQPDIIIECGTAYGGSANFYGDMLDLNGKGMVISIDIGAVATPPHHRVTYITGRTTAADTLEAVKDMIRPEDAVMVVLDSDHRRIHVKRELYYYSELVTPGQYLVVEDAYYGDKMKGPAEAIQWFMRDKKGKRFTMTKVDHQFVTGVTRGGWLCRK